MISEPSRTLTDRQKALLDFEAKRPVLDPRGRVEREFEVAPEDYYRELNALIDTAEAEAYDPTTVLNLRKMCDQKAAERSGLHRDSWTMQDVQTKRYEWMKRMRVKKVATPPEKTSKDPRGDL